MFYWIVLFVGIIILPHLILEFCRRNGLANYLITPKESLSYSWILLLPVYNIFLLILVLGYNTLGVNNVGNFLLHIVGGGFSCAIIWEFLVINCKIKITTGWQLFGLVCLTSVFGCINELFEMTIELFVHTKLVIDNWDTWRDLLANFVGAGIGFLLIKYFRVMFRYFFVR